MIDPLTVVTVLGMAVATYLTRICGYFFLRNRILTPRLTAVMENAPGCVLITVIAPAFVAGGPADLIALLITMAVARRLPMLATVLVAIATAGLLRQLLG